MNEIVIKNKKAYHDYTILETYVAGIVLTGTEIKSIRKGKASIIDSFCIIENGEVFLINAFINKFSLGTYNNHEERRNRKLLLTKKEIRKIYNKSIIKGNTIIPLSLFINKHGFCKIQIAIAKGNTNYDKRNLLKEKDIQKEINKSVKNYG